MELRNLIPALKKDGESNPEHEREDLDEQGRAPRDEWYPLSALNRYKRVQKRTAKARQRKMNKRYRLGVRRNEMIRQTREAQLRVMRGEEGSAQMRANVVNELRHAGVSDEQIALMSMSVAPSTEGVA